MIRARGLALEGVLAPADFEVGAGEFALLTGPSGCGKSVLLHTLAGLRPLAARGELLVAGMDALAHPAPALAGQVALVFQDASERMARPDVASTLAFRLENLGWAPERTRDAVAAALARLQLPARRPVWELSEGQAKRVALEAALVAQPRVLLLDEPLAGLDPAARRALLARLATLSGGVTVLVAEHRVADIAPLAGRRLHMDGGRIREGTALVA